MSTMTRREILDAAGGVRTTTIGVNVGTHKAGLTEVRLAEVRTDLDSIDPGGILADIEADADYLTAVSGALDAHHEWAVAEAEGLALDRQDVPWLDSDLSDTSLLLVAEEIRAAIAAARYVVVPDMIRRGAVECERAAVAQGFGPADGDYELTAEDCEAITDAVKAAHGRMPTEREWHEAGVAWIGDRHYEGK